MMLLAGGGVDLVMHERERVRLQDSLDAGLLAAAALTQQNGAERTIRQYLDAASFKNYQLSVTETKTLSSRQVSATVTETIGTTFLKLARIPTLDVSAVGTAEEAVKKIEVSFVLDLSGSMRLNGRIQAMRPAVKNFIAGLLEGDKKTTTSVSLIPYAGQVNVGAAAFDAMGGSSARKHDKSSCYSNLESNFTAAIPNFSATDQVPQFSTWLQGTNDGFDPWNCPTNETAISYLSNDAAALQTEIDRYHMFDGTGTHIAVKWGLHLLDPAFRSTLAVAKASGVSLVSPTFSDRPAEFDDKTTLKYMVVMTDGEIVDQQRPTSGQYVNEQPTKGGTNKQALAKNVALNVFSQGCEAAKARGVIVYTIGFAIATSEASYLPKLKACASSADKFYEAKTTDISKVLQDIQRSISPLRLTN